MRDVSPVSKMSYRATSPAVSRGTFVRGPTADVVCPGDHLLADKTLPSQFHIMSTESMFYVKRIVILSSGKIVMHQNVFFDWIHDMHTNNTMVLTYRKRKTQISKLCE